METSSLFIYRDLHDEMYNCKSWTMSRMKFTSFLALFCYVQTAQVILSDKVILWT